ncbi:MAG TPA: protein kinase [Thermoanaerobaculia bacterium]
MSQVETATGVVSHYRIVQRLGSGGMSEVYLAEDTILPRVVALKVLPADRPTDDVLQHRLMREARTASALSHPNIARIYEAGEDEGRFFIAMEYVDGRSLDALVADGPLPIDETVRIALQLVAAVDEAHRSGVVHRDLKPSNVMLTRSGEVKVLDFGLAKFDNAEASPVEITSWKTESGLVVGTPPYMSPEQASGRRVDQRSDIFSIGTLLYELVTARRPFEGTSVQNTVYKVLSENPEPMARFNYDLPLELERIVRKCLEKSADRRYQTAAELLVDLRNLDRDRQAGPRRTRPRLRGPAAFAKARLIWIAAALLIFTAGAILVLKQTAVGSAPLAVHSIVVLPFANQEGHGSDALSEGIADQVISEISQSGRDLTVIARNTSFQWGPSASPMAVRKSLKADAILKGTTYVDGDRVFADFEIIDTRDGRKIGGKVFERSAADVPTLAVAIRDEVLRSLHIVPSSRGRSTLSSGLTVKPDAYDIYMRGLQQWSTRTPEGLNAAIRSFRQAIDREPRFAPAYAGLANTYSLLERYANLPNAASRSVAIAAAERAVELDPQLPEAHASLGSVRETYEWRWADAAAEYREAIRLNPSYATAHHWYALLLTRLSRFPEARTEIARASELDPRSPVIAAAVANVDYYAGDFRRSADEARAALLLKSDFVPARLQLVLSLLMSGDKAGALRELEPIPDTAPERLFLGAMIRAVSGEQAAARAFTTAAANRPGAAANGFPLAMVDMLGGDRAAALKSLYAAANARSFWIGYVAVEPVFAPLHGDPEFKKLLDRIGLAGTNG